MPSLRAGDQRCGPVRGKACNRYHLHQLNQYARFVAGRTYLMGALFRFIGLNWRFFAGVTVAVLVGWAVVTCQDRGKQVTQLTLDNSTLTEQNVKIGNRLVNVLDSAATARAERDTCQAEQNRADRNYKTAETNRVRQYALLRQRVSQMTNQQKQDTILQILARTDTITITKDREPLGVIEVSGKQIAYYSESQQNLLTWAVLEGNLLKQQRDTTNRQAATIPEIKGALRRRILTRIRVDAERGCFLGLGYRHRMEKLLADAETIIK